MRLTAEQQARLDALEGREDLSSAEKAELAMKYFFENTTQYAGNFEREASETISGSIGQLTAAVQTWSLALGIVKPISPY